MKSYVVPSYWKCYHQLPEQIQNLAKKNYRLFSQKTNHPSLNFKPLLGQAKIWSVRIGDGYRAAGSKEGDIITWFWIGTHEKFNKLF
jgi:hypothetical protein